MMKRRVFVVGTVAVTVGVIGQGHAAGLGIPLDGFLVQFTTFVQGLGLVLGTVGLAGWVGSLFDNPFSTILAGSINYFTKAGLLGGGLFILPTLGLVAGAMI